MSGAGILEAGLEIKVSPSYSRPKEMRFKLRMSRRISTSSAGGRILIREEREVDALFRVGGEANQ